MPTPFDVAIEMILEQTPTPLSSLLLDLSPRIPLFSCFELSQTLHLLQDVLEQVFPPNDIEMPADLWVFAREAIDFGLGKAAA
jgi:hypothetical protein